MTLHERVGSVVCGLLLAGLAAAAETSEHIEVLDTVLVVGEQPGPGMWKVSKDGHVLWVLAALRPLPRKMTWRTGAIEARIAHSQEVLYRGDVQIRGDIGMLRALTLVPAALRIRKMPDGKSLKDVLPPEAYARWQALSAKYLEGDEDIERWRPALALERLRSAAFRQNGLQGGQDVYEVIGRIRKKHKVARRLLPTAARTVRVPQPREMVREAGKIDVPDLPCFIRGLDSLESEVERGRRVANAWARGDIAQLRALHRDPLSRASVRESCAYALLTALRDGDGEIAGKAAKMFADLEWHAEWAGVQSKNDWVQAAVAALSRNMSTFAVLSLDEVLRPDGCLESLRALGYVVEEPRQAAHVDSQATPAP